MAIRPPSDTASADGVEVIAFPAARRPGNALVRWAVAFWVVLIVAHCGRAFLIPWSDRHLTGYPPCHTAGQAWVAHKDLYVERDHSNALYYRYSPIVAFFLVPCGAQSLVMGCFTWRVLNVVVYLAGLVALARTCLSSWSASDRAVFFLLTGMAGASGLIDAITNAPLLGLMLLALAGALRQRWNLATLCLCLAVLLKIYPIAAALLFILIWPRQLGWRFVLGMLIGLGLPFVLTDPAWVYRQYQGWYRVVSTDQGRQDWPLDSSYRDLRLLFRVWATPLPAWGYTAIQLSAAAALAGLTLYAKRVLRPSARLGLFVLGLAVCWMLVLGPAPEGTTYVMLSPFLAWAVVDAWQSRASFPTRGVVAGACVLMVVACAAVWFPGGKRFHNWGPHPICGLVVTGYLLYCFLQEMRRESVQAVWGERESWPEAALRRAA